MKLKEIPKSLWKSAMIAAIPLDKLASSPEEKIPALVSLTSIPSRLNTLHLTIRSVLQQKYLPEKIILWLQEDLKAVIPQKLKKLQGDLFEIRFSPYTFSHRKLIHSLEMHADKVIITCDDDLLYPDDMIKVLFEEHRQFPDAVIGNQCRQMTYTEGSINSYSQWPFVPNDAKVNAHLMPVGAFGVLYPPKSLDVEVTDKDLFMRLTPKADDLWFKAMTIKNRTLSRVNTHPSIEPIPIWGTQKIALKKINKEKDFNKVQWQRVCDHYQWSRQKIEDLIQVTAQ